MIKDLTVLLLAMDMQNIFYDQALSPEALDFLESSKMTSWNCHDLG